MITSYVNPQRSLLYLSLVGPLNEYSANDLVNEYYERHGEDLRQCILDLSGAEGVDGSGLNVLHRIALLTQVDGIEFSVVAGGSTIWMRSPPGSAAERSGVSPSMRCRVEFATSRASDWHQSNVAKSSGTHRQPARVST